MWQKFTERARKVVYYAAEVCKTVGEGYVAPEHLLLGMIRYPDCIACRVLHKHGIALVRLEQEVRKNLAVGESKLAGDMILTDRTKHVIELAYEEARQLGDAHLGTEHLLLGIVSEHDSLGGRILRKLGLDQADLISAREKVREAQHEVRG